MRVDDGSLKSVGNLALLSQGKEVDWTRHLHNAKRAGLHADIRLGLPETGGLFSWAIPRNRFPEASGESVLAIQQPIHRHSYGSFEGTIPEGRGAGTVEIADKGRAVITEATPGKIRFALLHPRYPKEYMLVKKQDKNWFLVNVTGSGDLATKYGKMKFKSTSDPEPYMTGDYAVSPKIDGAAALIHLLKNRIDVSSVRPSKTGQPLKYTWKIGGLDRVSIPPSLQGAVLRGETYGVAKGKVVPPNVLSGLLNASTLKSRDKQREAGIRLLIGLYGRADMPDQDRKQLQKAFLRLSELTGGRLHPIEETDNPEEARKLLERIKAGRHPLTEEGVVFRPKAGGVPIKHKLHGESDVYIREIFPAETADGSIRAGGFTYSLTPTGPIVGRVGSGFRREEAEDMMANPSEWIGRKTRIRSQGQFESGAHRSPFISRHEG